MERQNEKTLKDYLREVEKEHEILLNSKEFIIVGATDVGSNDIEKGFTIVNATMDKAADFIVRLITDVHQTNKNILGEVTRGFTMATLLVAFDKIIKADGISKQEFFDEIKNVWLKGCDKKQ